MNRQVGQVLVALSFGVVLAGISESASAKKPEPPSMPFYFVDGSNPPKVIGTALSIDDQGDFGGIAQISVSGPNGNTTKIFVKLQRSQFFSGSPVVFESQDCSGAPFVPDSNFSPSASSHMPGSGPVYTIVQPAFSSPVLGQSMLFVATGSVTQTITIRSYAFELTLGATGYELSCIMGSYFANGGFPADLYGNIYNTYHPPFNVVVP